MKRLIPLNLVVLITLLSTLSLANDKPNIIVITADDLGYGDVGCYGAKPENIKTPHIDRLAAEGLRFTSAYCSASTCPPEPLCFIAGYPCLPRGRLRDRRAELSRLDSTRCRNAAESTPKCGRQNCRLWEMAPWFGRRENELE